MTDRLAELLRQRALLEEHLAWLNREIADAEKSSDAGTPAVGVRLPSPPTSPTIGQHPPTAAVQAAVVSTVVSRVVSPPADLAPAADAILDKYRVPATSLQQDVRKGCFLYFTIALVLFAVGVVVLYFAISGR